MLIALLVMKLVCAVARVVADLLKGRGLRWKTWCKEHPDHIASLVVTVLVLVTAILEIVARLL